MYPPQSSSPELTDIRDETCTNLSIFLTFLIRKIQPGETIHLLTGKKQLIQIEEVLIRNGLSVTHEIRQPDILVHITRPE